MSAMSATGAAAGPALRWWVQLILLAGTAPMVIAMPFQNSAKAETDHLSADLYVTNAGPNLKNAPATFENPMVLVAGGVFAMMALFLALTSQRERRVLNQTTVGPGCTGTDSPASARKVRWQLGSGASEENDDDADAPSPGLYINHGNGKRGHKHRPSYDGMYWNSVDPDEAGHHHRTD
eukprot:m.87334 g.87334  ORF g.87334 m.87334 type:complete len:179 (+) comp19924_c0_seq2:239-775(+)